MKHLQFMGAVWRVSDRNYRKLVRDITADADIDLDRYGKMMVTDFENFEDLQRANAPKKGSSR